MPLTWRIVPDKEKKFTFLPKTEQKNPVWPCQPNNILHMPLAVNLYIWEYQKYHWIQWSKNTGTQISVRNLAPLRVLFWNPTNRGVLLSRKKGWQTWLLREKRHPSQKGCYYFVAIAPQGHCFGTLFSECSVGQKLSISSPKWSESPIVTLPGGGVRNPYPYRHRNWNQIHTLSILCSIPLVAHCLKTLPSVALKLATMAP